MSNPYCLACLHNKSKETHYHDCVVMEMMDEETSTQRKHEATHGWRNPPSVYEEDRSET